MEASKMALKEYIKILEALETLYNLYSDSYRDPKYLRRIQKKYILRKYSKIKKTKILSKLDCVEKAKKMYRTTCNYKIQTKSISFRHLKFIDKVLWCFEKNYKKNLIKTSELTNNKDSYCSDCNIRLKTKMIKYHVLGKKHMKNKKTDKFYCLKIDEKSLLKKGRKLIQKIKKEANESKITD